MANARSLVRRAPMQRVNEFVFYELAIKLHALAELPNPLHVGYIWLRLWNARQLRVNHRIPRCYSVRSACIGSNRDALHAGAKQARTATANSVAVTPERTTGSRGFVPKSIDWKMRVAAKLITKPSPSPNSAGRRPSISINRKS